MTTVGPGSGTRRLLRADAGFTLIEVVVALSILVLVTSAGVYFFMTGTRAISHQQRTQNAVVVANQAMESAYGVAPGRAATTDPFGLVVGRSQSVVDAAWTAASAVGVEGLSDTYRLWDTTTPLPDEPNLAVSMTTTLSGMDYTATTLVGSCFRPIDLAAGASSSCTTLPGLTSAPAVAPAGYTQLLRVMVVVTWKSTAGTCTDAGTCSYQLSALIDPSTDLVWSSTTQPVAVDDNAVVTVGESVDIDVLANDIIGPVATNPVQKLTVTSGTGTIAVLTGGKVRFTAPTNASGPMTFTYSLKDGQGKESNLATVTVTVNPKAVADSASGVRNIAVTIPVTANDQGTPASVTVIATSVTPSTATATASGTSVVFTASATGTYTFEYTFTDASGLVSTPATVTVTVTAYAPPLVADLKVVVPAVTQATLYDLNMLGITGNPGNYLVEIMSSAVTAGQLQVNGSNYNLNTNRIGTTIGYSPQTNTAATYTFQYRVLTPDSAVKSEIRTITLVIMPTPAADAYTMVSNTTSKLSVGSNDAPSNFGGTTTFQAESVGSPTCGTLAASQPDLKNGIITYTAPRVERSTTCTFQYRIKGTGSSTDLVSAPATVTITVNPR